MNSLQSQMTVFPKVLNGLPTATIAILGAGITGLSTAMTLIEASKQSKKDVRIIILEARNRVGGRTFTESIDIHSQSNASCNNSAVDAKVSIDVGGQWVGPTQKRILKYIKEFKLELKEQVYVDKVHPPSHGLDSLVECVGYENPILDEESVEEFRTFIQKLVELIEEINASTPWTHPRAEEFDNMSMADFIKRYVTTEAALREAFLLTRAVIASEASQCSFLYFLFFLKSGGGIDTLCDGDSGAQKWYIVGGSQQISKKMAAFLIESGVEIRYEDAASKLFKLPNGKVEITTRSGFTTEADQVVVAMAGNVVVKHLEFNPPLPNTQMKFLGSVVGGNAVKTIIIFKEAFWLKTTTPQGHAGHFSELGPVQNMFTSEIGGYPSLVCLCSGQPAKILLSLSLKERRQVILSQIKALFFPKDQNTTSNQCDSNGLTDMESSESDENLQRSSDESDYNLKQSTLRLNTLEKFLGVLSYTDKLWPLEEFTGGCYSGVWPPDGTFSKYGPEYVPRVGNDSFDDEKSSPLPLSASASSSPAPVPETCCDSTAWKTCLQIASTEVSDEFVGYMEGALRAGEIVGEIIMKRLYDLKH